MSFDRTLLAQGREAEVFDLGDGTVLKRYRREDAGAAADREAGALMALERAGVPGARLLARVDDAGHPALVLRRVDGTDWLRRLGTRPLSVLSAGRHLARVHAQVLSVAAPAELPSVRERLRGRLATSEELDGAERERALDTLEALPEGGALCHGDFHFENVLGPWAAPTVIDWGAAARGPAVADVARSLVILGYGEPPDHAHPVVRRLAPVARRHVLAAYQRHVVRGGVALLHLAAWRQVHLAARLGETTATETAVLRAQLAASDPELD